MPSLAHGTDGLIFQPATDVSKHGIGGEEELLVHEKVSSSISSASFSLSL